MTPSPELLGRSAYTVLGFAGYTAAVAVQTTLTIAWRFTLGERLAVVLVLPLAFLLVAGVATALKGREWIVFYHSAAAAVAATALVGLVIDANVARFVDVTVIAIGTLQAFGRIGCLRVACCHGRPTRRGVSYDQRHIALGLWSALAYRPLVPVQLIEAIGSAVLVVGALLSSAEPGRGACVFAVGYALMRFSNETLRGDPARPVALGVTEAQWWSAATAVACAIARPTWWTAAASTLLAMVTVAIASTRHRRELIEPRHMYDLDHVCAAVLADPAHARRETALGVAATCHVLPDGRLDWVWSSTHPTWSIAIATRLADTLYPGADVVPGRSPGVVHILVTQDAAARRR